MATAVRTRRAVRRVGTEGQIDFQGRSHDPIEECGRYRLVQRVGANRWVVEWTSACCRDGFNDNRSTLQFVSADAYSRYF